MTKTDSILKLILDDEDKFKILMVLSKGYLSLQSLRLCRLINSELTMVLQKLSNLSLVDLIYKKQIGSCYQLSAKGEKIIELAVNMKGE